jgi:hypothetical protein
MRDRIENAIATTLAFIVACIPITTALMLMSYINTIL